MSDMDQAQTSDGDPVRVRVDVKGDSVVREYEEKYYGTSDWMPTFTPPPAKPKRIIVSGASVSQDERTWAAIAHGSAVLTLVLGLLTGGAITPFTLLIPLGIYLYYRQRSEFVAYAALQAFALQVLGTVGWIALLVTGVLAGALVSVVLAITLVGLLIVPFIVVAMVLFGVASLALPLGMTVLGIIGALETNQGKWYSYPYVSRWIDRRTPSSRPVIL